jgi:1-phosphofructokinase family hexose kinase
VITVGGFNTSVDKALDLADLRPGEVHRAQASRAYPGGKGLHVARAVAALGEPVSLVGLIDAAHRGFFQDPLRRCGVDFHGVEAGASLRTNLTIRDAGGSRVTEILEPGPTLDEGVRQALCARFVSLASESVLAVLSGSLPPGFGAETYSDLVAALRAAGIRCLVDASGGLLRSAVQARPFLIKPNHDEMESLVGEKIAGPASAVEAARRLQAGGVTAVVVSLGVEGVVAVMAGRACHAWAPPYAPGNTVGSGDCLLAGLAVGFSRGLAFEEVVRLGAACGTANTLTEEIGLLRREDVDALLPQVRVSELP